MRFSRSISAGPSTGTRLATWLSFTVVPLVVSSGMSGMEAISEEPGTGE